MDIYIKPLKFSYILSSISNYFQIIRDFEARIIVLVCVIFRILLPNEYSGDTGVPRGDRFVVTCILWLENVLGVWSIEIAPFKY